MEAAALPLIFELRSRDIPFPLAAGFYAIIARLDILWSFQRQDKDRGAQGRHSQW